jgi:outer membrane protein OmpA-like peptidoglycan-associated protein
MSSYQHDGREKYNAWTWGIAALIALALLWLWITGRGPAANCCNASGAAVAAAPAAAPMPTPAPAPVAAAPAASSAPVAAPVAAPVPAPAVAKPVAALFFDTGKTSVPKDTAELIGGVVTYLKQNPESKAVVSGFNDPRGNAQLNAELSKNRAKAAREALKAAGIDEARIELRKPADTNQAGDPKQARRVEISVEP